MNLKQNEMKFAEAMSPAGDLQQKQVSPVIEMLLVEGVQFLVNTKLEPILFIPDSPFQQHWPVDHDRVAAYIATAFYDKFKGFIRPAVLNSVLTLIKQECYHGGRLLTEVEGAEAEEDPIVQALTCYMNKQQSFDGMTSGLLAALNDTDIRKSVSAVELLPLLTNIFSRRLKRLVPALRGLGIEVVIEHKEDGSHCRVNRLPTFEAETDALSRQPSAQSSVASSVRGKDYTPTDGNDGHERLETISDGAAIETPLKLPTNLLQPGGAK